MSKIDDIKALLFDDESFSKFDNPTHPLYKDYKDRQHEKWHDRGYNNAIEAVLRIIGDDDIDHTYCG